MHLPMYTYIQVGMYVCFTFMKTVSKRMMMILSVIKHVNWKINGLIVRGIIVFFHCYFNNKKCRILNK